MQPKIRTIKPKFWRDKKVGQISLGARLLFLCTLNYADDEGRLEWDLNILKSFAFPHDEKITRKNVKVWMEQLAEKNFVQVYSYGDNIYAQIVNFKKHQRISRPIPSEIPSYEECMAQSKGKAEPAAPQFTNTPTLKPYNPKTDKVGNQYTDILVAVEPDLLNQEQKDERYKKMMAEMQSSEQWQIEVSTATGKRLQDIQQLLKQFGKVIKADEEYFKPLKQVKSHFRNWARKNDLPPQPIGFNPYNNIPLI